EHAIRKTGSGWHSRYSWRLAKLARISLNVLVGFTCAEESWLLIAIHINSCSVRRVQKGVDRVKPAPPFLALAGFLAPRKSIELIARTAFVLSVSRTLGLNCRTKSNTTHCIRRALTAGWLRLLSFELILTV